MITGWWVEANGRNHGFVYDFTAKVYSTIDYPPDSTRSSEA
jgi:hypothetical protein